MKKKKNEYKPQRHKKIIRNIISVVGTLLLAYVFIVIGYSVAKPFGEIGEIEVKPMESVSYSDDNENTELKNSEENVKAYWLKEKDIESIEDLEGLINVIGKDYNMVVVPLKIEGGKLNFSSSYDEAILADVCNDIDLSTIYDTIKSKGYTPVASINSMHDNLYPNTSKNSGFLVNSTKDLWRDSQNETGKPWLNPASKETKQYLSAITGEIATAGFKYIICTDMEYPDFSRDALDDIGGIVTETDRYLDLVDNINNMSQIAEGKGSTVWLELSAKEILEGKSEVFYKPTTLSTQKYVLKIDISEFNGKIKIDGKDVDFSKMTLTEKINTICTEIEKIIYKSSFIPEVYSTALNMNQKLEVEKVFEELGYDSYIFKNK